MASCTTVPVAACALLLLCAATLASSSSFEKRARFCGPYLVETLEALCGGEIFDPTQKRNHGRPSLPILPPWMTILEGGSPKLGFLDAKTALQLLRPSAHFGRQTRGIIEECCHKSCSISELSSYCGLVRPGAEE
uniref:Insulin n=1 Tax=Amblyomma variegatum TaxID=34610 RepID=F0J9V1_AMBVA|nr:TPA_inf: insulin precursor [Amblyomma variegatum]